ncbi:unnamed protein product [Staurois parvus]|uniref:Ig-like domain-containing protein n=1 Tax=Staurois parvus TaxID=386267 RepID=A0ABN9AM69_9NEOB|nr:unnamed protein product [Staurois parvus]
MTQTPDSISVSPGQTITITCTSSTGTGNNIAWYQQKSGKSPTLLIYGAATRHTGVPDRFTGRSDGSPYTLTITAVTEDDEGRYHCLQYDDLPHTVIQSRTKTSFLFYEETQSQMSLREHSYTHFYLTSMLTTCRPATAYKQWQGGAHRQKHVLKRLPSKQVGASRAPRPACPRGCQQRVSAAGSWPVFLPDVFPR